MMMANQRSRIFSMNLMPQVYHLPMKYLQGTFTVGGSSQAYRDGWRATFGREELNRLVQLLQGHPSDHAAAV
jgi:hypothetical protein